MESNELIKEIIDKFPMVWEKFLMEYLPEYEYKTDMTFFPDNGLSIDNQGCKVIIPFEYLYGLLEGFFSCHKILLHGIISGLYRQIITKINIEKVISIYKELQFQAILKACERLEAKLNG